MKGIYLTADIDLNNPSLGECKKILMQINIFNNNGLEVKPISLYSDKTLTGFDKIINRMPFIKSRLDTRVIHSLDDLDIKKYDFIYIRRYIFNSSLIKLLKRLKKENKEIKVIMEVPTYPYDQEYPRLADKPYLWKEKIARNKLYKYTDRILTYSRDEEIFSIPAISLSNAVDTRAISAKKETTPGNIINLIAVGRFSRWHGYERFIEGMNIYYKSKKKEEPEIVFHVVGEGRDLSLYKSLTEEYKLQAHVIFYGSRSGDGLNEVYDKCEIGLDSMGRHRAGIYYNSTLKGKEYGAKGLPIISGVETELDFYKEYEYYMRVPSDESPVDMKKVISFYNRIYGRETRKEVIRNIREFTIDHFDTSIAMKDVIDYIKGV